MDTFLCSYPTEVLLNHFTPHSFYVTIIVSSILVGKLGLWTPSRNKTTNQLLWPPWSFNGICYPPPLNIDGVEPEHSKSFLMGIMPSNELNLTTTTFNGYLKSIIILKWIMFMWGIFSLKLKNIFLLWTCFSVDTPSEMVLSPFYISFIAYTTRSNIYIFLSSSQK